MSNFTTVALANHRYLVEGTDTRGKSGSVVVDGRQWDELTGRNSQVELKAQLEESIEAFFAPLTEAIDSFNEAQVHGIDPLERIVLDEGSEGVEARPASVVVLNPHSQILRATHRGDTDRLIWVGDELELTAYQAPAPEVQTGDDKAEPVPTAEVPSSDTEPVTG